MMCVRIRSPFSNSPSLSPLRYSVRSKPWFSSFRPFSSSSSSPHSPAEMSAKAIEHVVLFNVKSDTDPAKINSMISGLNGLNSLDQVLHLTAGPLYRNRSSSFNFTHMLHSRYRSKDDLSGYSAHPQHMSVVKESVLPICDDIMAVDWIADNLAGPVALPAGAAMRVSFLKLKEGLGDGEKGEVFGVIGGIKDIFGSIDQISFGENFSPARAKGFSIASLAVFPGLNELDALDSNEETVRSQKEKVRDFLESVIVVDYLIPSPQSANL